MLHRRTLIGATTALAAGLAAGAQDSSRSYRIGYLGYTAVNTGEDERVISAFVQRLRDLGFVDGRNLVIEWRYAEGHNERYAEFAAEMVRLKADLVVAASGTAARAVMTASQTMPIVTTATPDPVRSGLVARLARPGGQLTGLTNLADDLVPKQLELLKAAIPSAKRVALARCPECGTTSGLSADEVQKLQLEREAAAKSLNVMLFALDVNAAEDFDKVTATLRRERPDAILLGANQTNSALQARWLALAHELRLPLFAPFRGFGAMLSYSADYSAIYRRAAEYIGKILNGAYPGDLPMEQPTTFELVVNLREARAIGVTLPPSFLLRADAVIE